MKCQFCGTELKDQARFCFKCGAQTGYEETLPNNQEENELDQTVSVRPAQNSDAQNQSPNEPIQNTKEVKSFTKKQKAPKKKKTKVTLICILSAIVVLLGGLAAVFFTSSAYSVYQKMNEGNFDRALIEYQRKVEDSSLETMLLDLLLKNRAENVVTDYKNGEVDHVLAAKQLETLDKMGFENAREKRIEVLSARAEEVVALFQAGTMNYRTATDALMELAELGYSGAEPHCKNIAKSYANFAVDRYENGQLTYQETMDILAEIQADGFIPVGALMEQVTASNDATNTMLKAEEYYENGQYENAIDEYGKIPESDKNYQAAQDKLNEVYIAYIQSTEQSAKSYIAAKNYKQAIRVVDAAYEILPDGLDTSALVAVREESLTAYKADVADQVEEAMDSERWAEAFTLIDNAIAFDNNEYFQNLKVSTEEAYVASVNTTVQAHLAKEDYISAKRVVDNALTILPGNSALKALQEMVVKATPVYLLDVCAPYYVTSSYQAYCNGETFKMGGTSYTNGFIYEDTGYAIFNLAGSYTSISFMLGHVDGTHMSNTTFLVYCDGILTLEIPVNAQDLPQKITLDVTGVQQVKFTSAKVSYDPACGLGNIIVK